MAVVQAVQHGQLQQLLVADPYLDWIVGWAVLIEPVVDQRHIHRAPCATRPAGPVLIQKSKVEMLHLFGRCAEQLESKPAALRLSQTRLKSIHSQHCMSRMQDNPVMLKNAKPMHQ